MYAGLKPPATDPLQQCGHCGITSWCRSPEMPAVNSTPPMASSMSSNDSRRVFMPATSVPMPTTPLSAVLPPSSGAGDGAIR